MGIPKKGSRALDVDGQRFRWMVRKGKDKYQAGKVKGCRVVTVQEDVEKPGAVLQVTLYTKDWLPWDEDLDIPVDDGVIAPEHARHLVRAALQFGWDPSKKGAPFLRVLADLPGWETDPPPDRPPTARPKLHRSNHATS